ncbi:MAG: hypothetical protein Q8N13_19085 [Acidovorax sp.]|nr:hypothetical protein [Acidovorax sp.]
MARQATQWFSRVAPVGCKGARFACLTVVLAVLAFSASSADIHPSELATLQQQVERTGWVRVMVTLERVGLGRLSGEQTRQLDAKAQRLYDELGNSVLSTGRWTNGLGQIGFYTDRAGIAMLSSTAAAERFYIDYSDKGRGRARGLDGSFEAIDNALIASPTVEVDLVLSTEEPPYTLQRDGSTRFDGPSEVNEVLDRLLTEPFAQHIQGIDRRLNPTLTPVVQARIDRVAFHGLVDSVHVRAVRLRGFVSPMAAIWDDKALELAHHEGRAEISILLRGGVTYAIPYTGPKSYQYQAEAHTKALHEILAAAGVDPLPPIPLTDANMGLAMLVVSKAQIEKLFAQRDPRILSLNGNAGTVRVGQTKSSSAPATIH